MSLRVKAWLLFGASFALLILAVLVILHFTVLRGFASLEESAARRDVDRALRAIDAEGRHLETTVVDWAEWDDSYAFVADGNATFVEANLGDSTMRSLELSLLAYLRPSGEVVYGRVFDASSGVSANLPAAVAAALAEEARDLLAPGAPSGRRGVFRFADGPRLVAIRPILRSDNSGPSRGILAMGRPFDTDVLAHLGDTLDLALSLRELESLPPASDFGRAATLLSLRRPVAILPLSSELIAAFGLVTDIHGEPAMLLRVTQGRGIAAQGRAVARYLLFALLAALAVSGLAVQLILERGVIARLGALDTRLREIARTGSLGSRVVVPGGDEVANLGRGVNTMLGALQHAEAAVRESEERYRAVVEDQTELICRWRPDGTVVFANQACQRFAAEVGADLVGAHFLAVAGDAAAPGETPAEAPTAARPTSTFLTRRRVDGALRFVQWANRGIFAPSGDLVEVQSIGRDVTRQRDLEAALHTCEREARTFLGGPADLNFLTDFGGSILASSEGTASRLEATGVRLVGGRIQELFGGEVAPAWRLQAEETIRTGLPSRFRLHHGARVLDLAVLPIRDEAGQLTRLGTVARDVTDQVHLLAELEAELSERNRLAEALEDAQEAFRQVSQSLRGVVWIREAPTGRVTYVSPGYEHVWGRSCESLYRDPASLLEAVDGQDRERVARALAAAPGPTDDPLEFRLERDGAPPRWVVLRQVRLEGGTSRPDRVFAVVEDISVQKQAEAESRRLEAQLRLLARRLDAAREEERQRLAIWIHDEIGQMLTALRLDLAWVLKRLPPRAPGVRDALTEMDALVAGKVGAVQQLAGELRPTLLEDLGFRAATEWLVREFQRRTSVAVEVAVEADEGAIPPAVSLALFRIVQEALTNIARHSGAARASLALAVEGNALVLRVADDGRGVRPEEATGPGALGILGMRERALAHGGRLEVATGPGGGTLLTVTIPREWSIATT